MMVLQNAHPEDEHAAEQVGLKDRNSRAH